MNRESLSFTLMAVLLTGSIGLSTQDLQAADDPVRLRFPVDSVTDIDDLAAAQRDGVPPLPEDAVGIGPGSPLLTTIPGEGTFICTANFVFQSGGRYYLGAAGHCFLPEGRKATHGTGADYNAGGVVTEVCVDFCYFGGEATGLLGDFVTLGQVAYARQTGPGGDIGNDFGIVEVPAALVSQLRPELPMWEGPTGTDGAEGTGQLLAHYGNGIDSGTFMATKGRAGTSLDDGIAMSWQANLEINGGDSGSAVVHATTDANDVITGTEALGLVTHGLVTGTVPLAWGTSIEQAITMATQAGLGLQLVLEGGSTGGGGTATAAHVQAIDTAAAHFGNGKHRLTTTVTIVDAQGSPAPGVTVAIEVSTPQGAQAAQGTTGANGQVALEVTGNAQAHGTWTSCVQSLSGTGYTYDSAANVETCQSQAVT